MSETRTFTASDLRTAVASARGDLDAAQRRLSALLARENVGSTSADRWNLWTAGRDVAAAEVARLTALVGKLKPMLKLPGSRTKPKR